MILSTRHPHRELQRRGRAERHDIRFERVGGWAGPVEPQAPVGKFAGPPRFRRQAAGGWAGDPDAQRQGSFADRAA